MRMKCVLSSVHKGNTNNIMEKKWLCEIRHTRSWFIKLWKSNAQILITYVLRRWGQTAKEINAKQQCRTGEEEGCWKSLRVNEIKTTTSLTRYSMNTTIVADANLDSNSKQHPRFHAPTSLYVLRGNYRWLNCRTKFLFAGK